MNINKKDAELFERYKYIFSRCLVTEMNRLGVDAEELAFRMSVDKKTVVNYTRGKMLPNTVTLIKMTRALRCPVETLMPFCNPDFKIMKGKKTAGKV